MNIYHTNHYLGAFLALMDIEKDITTMISITHDCSETKRN